MSSDPRDRISSINRSPLQLPGRDKLCRETVLGGPTVALDVRMYLSVADLEQLLDVARTSMTRRVVLNRPGLKVKVWETPNGHRYETWSLIAADAKPETTSLTSNLRDGKIVL